MHVWVSEILYYPTVNDLQLYSDPVGTVIAALKGSMIRTPFTLAIAFTLACIANIHAIGITIDFGSSAYSEVRFNNENPRDAQVVVIAPQEGMPYEFSTFAQVNESTSSATWGFSNKQKEAIFYGSASLRDDDPMLVSEKTRAATTVRFTLTETVDYAFSGTFNGILNQPENSANLPFQSIYADIGGPVATHPSRYIYAGTSQSTTSGLLSLPAAGDVGLSSGGPLTPGRYVFSFYYDLVGGVGNGQFQLILSRPHPEYPPHPEHPHVPDAGSTLTFLGMALGGLGFIRRR